VVLRVAGIYGPGRDRMFRQLLGGRAVIEDDGSRHVNMIHRDDVVTAIVAALKRGCPGEIYNVVDDAPTRQSEFLGWLAGTLGTPMPGRVDSAPLLKQRQATNKRVNNNKARTELGWQPAFPTFREGYAAQISAALNRVETIGEPPSSVHS
jgi:nucleoside-diphosphate-sugar epimerase